MAFQRILHELVSSTSGALGAIFLDQEGETVEVLTDRPLEADDNDLKVIGAYSGIFLTRLRNMCTDAGIGHLDRFKLDFESTTVLTCDLKDGYYVVLLVDASANEGVAWQRLVACRNRLLDEM
jgi:predicted regulator of Ras-like GTPase activity (Roadblock/LC7/MglB family)